MSQFKRVALLILIALFVTASQAQLDNPADLDLPWPLPMCEDTPLTVRPKNRDVGLWHLWRCNYVITIMGDQRSRLGRTWRIESDASVFFQNVEGCDVLQQYRGLKAGQGTIEPTNTLQWRFYIKGDTCTFRLSARSHARKWNVRLYDTCFNRSKCRWPQP